MLAQVLTNVVNTLASTLSTAIVDQCTVVNSFAATAN